MFKNPNELYSARDQATLALRKYGGLNVTPFSWINRLNAPIALAMQQEEVRLQKMQDTFHILSWSPRSWLLPGSKIFDAMYFL